MLIERESLIRLPFSDEENDLAIEYFLRNKKLVINKIIEKVLEYSDYMYSYYKKQHKVIITLPSFEDNNDPIISFIGWVPKIILAQINTHRTLSKNASSSRAIPNKALIRMAIENPYIPVFTKEQKGMQGKNVNKKEFRTLLRKHLELLYTVVKKIYKNDVLHKQNINRYLEPFILVPVIITGTLKSYDDSCVNTSWNNFIFLRNSHEAQAEIRHVAHTILIATSLLNNLDKTREEVLFDYELRDIKDFYGSEFVTIRRSDIHVPKSGISQEELKRIKEKILNRKIKEMSIFGEIARISSLTYKLDTDERNVALTQRLLEERHMSPFEHVALYTEKGSYYNLLNWKSVRYLIEKENYLETIDTSM